MLCIFGAHRLFHAISISQANKKNRRLIASARDTHTNTPDISLPAVTIQAPVFNERYVVERLIDSLAAMDYPREKLQIQIIDDSTDESLGIAANRIAMHRANGINIEHVLRKDRGGFKAGALQAAMDAATGEFIAIFDADFTPRPDFLKRTIPHFSDPAIGMTQTRWSYLNRNSNLLTRVQAMILDAHFGLEQIVRSGKNLFFNFNGTAGIWRRTTIDDAGGWRADTLTEDLDLSYRAQMKGWKFLYCDDIDCPSELPVDMASFKSQQHRWAKGAIEVMKKMLKSILRGEASRASKLEAAFHLTANFSYLIMLIDAVIFVLPSIYFRTHIDAPMLVWLDIPLFFFASITHAIFFLASQRQVGNPVLESLRVLPLLLATSIGLSVNNGRAVLEAVAGHVTDFIRTPKTGDLARVTGTTAPAQSAKPTISYKAISAKYCDALELGIAAIYFAYLAYAIIIGQYIIIPFLTLFAFGFLFTGALSVRAKKQSNANV